MYRRLRPLLFRADPESAHYATLSLLALAARSGSALGLLEAASAIRDSRLNTTAFGLRFPNPLGLAAGLDKNALALPAWPALGFGFVEVGTVTALPQEGNPRPRLFRLPEDDAIINRMGFNNEGAEAVARRLGLWRTGGRVDVPVGINVGKSRPVPLEEAADDYRHSLELLWPYADYLVINVSSPNTPGLRELQGSERLSSLLATVDAMVERDERPVLLKIAPDLTDEGLDEVVEVAGRHRVAGLVAVNTTLSRVGLSSDPGHEGGLSGRPLASRSLEVLRRLRPSGLPLVSVGGVFDPEDLIERLRAGASLVQVYTGFIYGGPGTSRRLLQGLLRHLEREGIPDVPSLIGVDA